MDSSVTTPNIFPVLRYADAPGAIGWLERAFGLTRREVFADADGGVAHAELDLGADVIGISSARGPVADNPWSLVDQGVYIRVDDIEAHYALARASGADIARPLTSTSYGAREYTLRDDDGHLWGFGTYGMGASTGESRVWVGLHYQDGTRGIDWLRRAAGFEVTLELIGPESTVAHAELLLAPGVVMVSSGPRDSGVWGERRQCLYVYELDPDAHAARAAAAGAAIVRPPETTSYGARAYYVRDCGNFLWAFGTYRPERQIHARG